MTKLSPDTPKPYRSKATPEFEPQSKPAKKDGSGRTSAAAKQFAVKAPRNRG